MISLRRRHLLVAAPALLGSDALAQGTRVRRVGLLLPYPEQAEESTNRVRIFTARLESLGWRIGHNLAIERGFAHGSAEHVATAVRDMVARMPEVIATISNPLTAALSRETRTIPVVFGATADPVGTGLVASMARPGGNITGFANFDATIGSKWVELLKEAKPSISRMLAIHHPQTAFHRSFLREAQAAARNLGVDLVPAPFNQQAEIERAVVDFAESGGGGVIAMPHPQMATAREMIARQALRFRLPSTAAFRQYVASGVLMSYGNDSADTFVGAAEYVDRILRGARPQDLPVQMPTRIDLFVNAATARAIGLELPSSLLARATEIIE